MEISVNKVVPSYALGALYAALTGALGAKMLSVRGNGTDTIVLLADNATSQEQTTASTTVTAFDASPYSDPVTAAAAVVTQAATDKGANAFDNLTVAQADAYIQSNVTDLASAKAALKILVRYIAWMERRITLLEKKNT